MAAPFPGAFPIPDETAPPPTALGLAASANWVRKIVITVKSILQGKLNASVAVRMLNGAASTTITDARITATSNLQLQPLTTNAAALLYGAPYVLVSAQNAGSVTFAHANTANTDQTFNLLIIG